VNGRIVVGTGEIRMNLESDVLVLNGNFLPLNVTKVRRSIVLIINGKAELIEPKDKIIHTSSDSFEMPSIIRLFAYIKPFNRVIKMTRSELFTRDQQRCQYCGLVTQDLTLDHVLPRSRGGRYIWENIVSACIKCNHKKAGRTPKEASMQLLTKPSSPPHDPYYPFYRFLKDNEEWNQFVPVKKVI
tara:strand:- start:162 stop:719 length:558 start_codon:yes stop_codon:yes gene_type:complete